MFNFAQERPANMVKKTCDVHEHIRGEHPITAFTVTGNTTPGIFVIVEAPLGICSWPLPFFAAKNAYM